jgi:hypothetical protein
MGVAVQIVKGVGAVVVVAAILAGIAVVFAVFVMIGRAWDAHLARKRVRRLR